MRESAKRNSPTLYVNFRQFLDITNSMAYEPGGSMPHSQELSNNPYPEPNQPNSSYDNYFFKVHSNIVLPSTPRPP